jgi:hypothetical protein
MRPDATTTSHRRGDAQSPLTDEVLAYRTGLARRDMAIELGTATTRVYVGGYGIVLSEPSVVAVDPRSGEVPKVGRQAERLLEREPDQMVAVHPVSKRLLGLTAAQLGRVWACGREVGHSRVVAGGVRAGRCLPRGAG